MLCDQIMSAIRKTVECRLVFDSCSQRPYITDDRANILLLSIMGKDSLLIKTFRESDARLRMYNIVRIGIKTEFGGTLYVRAFVVPVICGLKNAATSKETEYLIFSHGTLTSRIYSSRLPRASDA